MSKETSFTFDFYPDRNRGGGFPSPSLSVKNDISYKPGHSMPRTRDYQLVTSEKPKEGEFYEWRGPVAMAWSTTYPKRDDFLVGKKFSVGKA